MGPTGNIELYIWIFTAAGVWAFLQDRNKTAAMLWGLAAATKLYPIILLVLLVAKLRLRAVVLGLATFVMASVLSMAYLGPSMSVALRRSLRNVFGYQNVRTSEVERTRVCSKPLGFHSGQVCGFDNGSGNWQPDEPLLPLRRAGICCAILRPGA
jgi:hypothetical protein